MCLRVGTQNPNTDYRSYDPPPPRKKLQVVGAMTKAAVGVAVDRAAATISEERGLPPPKRRAMSSPGGRGDAPGSKRKAFASFLSNLVTFLRADDEMGFAGQGKVRLDGGGER